MYSDMTRSTLLTSTGGPGTAGANQLETQAEFDRGRPPQSDANVAGVNLADGWGLERDEIPAFVPAWTRKLRHS